MINITKTGIYTLKFLGGARGPTGAALPEKLAFVVEFNGDYQQYEHSKSPNTFIEYSKEYYITDSGNYTLILRNDHQNGSEYNANDDTDQTVFIANVKLLDEDDIQTAVNEWIYDSNNAELFYGNISDWNVSNVTDMHNLFRDKTSFNEDISSWDVSKVTNMFSMFGYAHDFNQNIDSWDVSKVTNMRDMFWLAFDFNEPLNNWNVSNVVTMLSLIHI